MSLKITECQVGTVTILNCEGRATQGEGSSTLRDTARSMVDNGKKFIILDFSNVSYIDSTGVGELVSLLNYTQSQGGKLKLLRLTKRVRDLLRITGLYTAFEVYDNEVIAIASFNNAAVWG